MRKLLPFCLLIPAVLLVALFVGVQLGLSIPYGTPAGLLGGAAAPDCLWESAWVELGAGFPADLLGRKVRDDFVSTDLQRVAPRSTSIPPGRGNRLGVVSVRYVLAEETFGKQGCPGLKCGAVDGRPAGVDKVQLWEVRRVIGRCA